MFKSALLILMLVPLAVGAADIPLAFESEALERRYEVLIEELRCLVCQNQSLADSSADLAQDMRELVHRMLVEGRSDDEVRQFLVDRYGDFVLYDPPLKVSTIALWSAPAIMLLLAILVVARVARSSNKRPPTLNDEEQRILARLRAERD
ncbi:MAG: cytochrome c-type biogenesis protein [Pseudomonadota bacterium]